MSNTLVQPQYNRKIKLTSTLYVGFGTKFWLERRSSWASWQETPALRTPDISVCENVSPILLSAGEWKMSSASSSSEVFCSDKGVQFASWWGMWLWTATSSRLYYRQFYVNGKKTINVWKTKHNRKMIHILIASTFVDFHPRFSVYFSSRNSKKKATELTEKPLSVRSKSNVKLTLIVLMWRIGWAHNNVRK